MIIIVLCYCKLSANFFGWHMDVIVPRYGSIIKSSFSKIIGTLFLGIYSSIKKDFIDCFICPYIYLLFSKTSYKVLIFK